MAKVSQEQAEYLRDQGFAVGKDDVEDGFDFGGLFNKGASSALDYFLGGKKGGKPATQKATNWTPWVIGGLAVAAVIVLVLLLPKRSTP